MTRSEAIEQIRTIRGTDLRALADRLGVTVWKEGKKNKGWAGHVIETYLGLPLNSLRSPDFGTWELKVVSLKRAKDERLRVKETMAITMINPEIVEEREFAVSHLLEKLRRILVVSRVWENQEERRSTLHEVVEFNLDNPQTYKQVKADYDLVRQTIKSSGFQALTGKMGKLIQPRTKGPGHGSTSRAFYARTGFVEHILGLSR